jgi:hypothetical protein
LLSSTTGTELEPFAAWSGAKTASSRVAPAPRSNRNLGREGEKRRRRWLTGEKEAVRRRLQTEDGTRSTPPSEMSRASASVARSQDWFRRVGGEAPFRACGRERKSILFRIRSRLKRTRIPDYVT